MASNPLRKPVHNRGDEQNLRGDMVGIVTELILRDILAQLGGAESQLASLDRNMYNARGGTRMFGCDVILDRQTGLGIDAKGGQYTNPAYCFKLSKAKHNALAGQCLGYFCVIVPPFAKTAVVADFVPFTDVDGWDTLTMPGRNDMLALELPEFIERYCPPTNLLQLGSFRNKHRSQDVEGLTHHPALIASIGRRYPTMGQYLKSVA